MALSKIKTNSISTSQNNITFGANTVFGGNTKLGSISSVGTNPIPQSGFTVGNGNFDNVNNNAGGSLSIIGNDGGFNSGGNRLILDFVPSTNAARIVATAGGNASSNASLMFYTTNGTTNYWAQNIDKNGYVTKMYNASAGWALSIVASGVQRGYTVHYDNRASCSAVPSQSGNRVRFTAPVTGKYLVTINLEGVYSQPTGGSGKTLYLFNLYGSFGSLGNSMTAGQEIIDFRGVSGAVDNTGTAFVLHLAANDYIEPDWYAAVDAYTSGGIMRAWVELLS